MKATRKPKAQRKLKPQERDNEEFMEQLQSGSEAESLKESQSSSDDCEKDADSGNESADYKEYRKEKMIELIKNENIKQEGIYYSNISANKLEENRLCPPTDI